MGNWWDGKDQGDKDYWVHDSSNLPKPEVPQEPDPGHTITCQRCRHELDKHVLEATDVFEKTREDGSIGMFVNEVWACATVIRIGDHPNAIVPCSCTKFIPNPAQTKGFLERK